GGVAGIKRQTMQVVLGVGFFAELGNSGSRADIAACARVVIQNDVATILARRVDRSMLVGKSEFQFVIAPQPILTEVVGIKRHIRLWSCGVIELESIFKEEVIVKTENWLRIGANSADRIQVEFVLDVRILCIHKPVWIRNERVFSLKHVCWTMLDERGFFRLLIWRESKAMIKILVPVQILIGSFVLCVVGRVGLRIDVGQLDELKGVS